MRKVGMIVPVMTMTGMNRGIAMRRKTELEPGEIERWGHRQQQDQAKAKPLPQRASPMLPDPVHRRSLGKARRFRHP